MIQNNANELEALLIKYNIKYQNKSRNDSEECYCYSFHNNDLKLYIEVYDDNDIQYVINDEKNKEIINYDYECGHIYELILLIIRFMEGM